MARLLFLGTSAALPTIERANTMLAVLPDDGDAPGLLVDCGDHVYASLLRAGLGPDAIGDLFITHAHIDHIGALPSLIESLRLSGRRRPLRILAIPEVLSVARALLAAFDFELTLDTWSFDVSLAPVEPDEEFALAGFAARVARMDHSVPSAGLRLELPRGPVTYTCDTQPTAAIRGLGAGSRLVIAECTFLQAQEAAARTSKHMTAIEAGEQATLCGAEELALVHIGGGWSTEQGIAEAARSFSGAITIPDDGDEITV
jgi:ribonuclease BN (tRNA processing enzyme)